MIYIEIDTHSEVPIYAQIMDRVRALVREGELPPASPLPSVRQLAADLAINPNTVAKAYSLLEREGLVETAGRRGTLIAPSARDVAHKAVGNRLEETVDRILQEASGLGVGVSELVKALERRAKARDKKRSEKESS